MKSDFQNLPSGLWRDEVAPWLGPRDWSNLRQTNAAWNDLLGPLVPGPMIERATNLAESHREDWISGAAGFFSHVQRLVQTLPVPPHGVLTDEDITAQLFRQQKLLEGGLSHWFSRPGFRVLAHATGTLWLPSGRMTSLPERAHGSPPSEEVPHQMFPRQHTPHAIYVGTYLCFRGLPKQNLLFAFSTFLLRLRCLVSQEAARLSAVSDSCLVRLAQQSGRSLEAATQLCLKLLDRLVVHRMRLFWGYGGERLAAVPGLVDGGSRASDRREL